MDFRHTSAIVVDVDCKRYIKTGRRERDSDSVSERQKAGKRTRTGKEIRYNNPTIIIDKALRKVI